MSTVVAFLGLGAMGRPMARRLLEAGNDLRVWNRSPGADADLVSAGAIRAATPGEAVRDAEVVITMLADPPALEQVLFGPDGVASSIGPGATLIEMSTVGPSSIHDAAQRLAPVVVLDAPVLGSVPAAETGRLQILVGGDAAAYERHADLLRALGEPVHVGASGAGATLKLASNAAAISALAAVGEVVAMTDRSGLDSKTTFDVLERGPLASLVGRWRDKMEGLDERADFRLALARKDLALAAEEAGRAGVELRVPAAAADRADEAIAAGLGDHDFTAVVAHLRA